MKVEGHELDEEGTIDDPQMLMKVCPAIRAVPYNTFDVSLDRIQGIRSNKPRLFGILKCSATQQMGCLDRAPVERMTEPQSSVAELVPLAPQLSDRQ